MKETIAEILKILDDNAAATMLLVNFKESMIHTKSDLDPIFRYILENLISINASFTPETPQEIKEISVLSVLENLIKEINANFPNSTNPMHRQATYIPSSSPASSAMAVATNIPATSSTAATVATNIPSAPATAMLVSADILARKSFIDELTLQLATNPTSFMQDPPSCLWKGYIIDRGRSMVGHVMASHNAAIFQIPFPTNSSANLALDECWCNESLSRHYEHNIRNTMEGEIIRNLVTKTTDRDAPLRIINIGSDRISLLIILARLHMYGFKKIQCINVELDDMKNYEEYPAKDQQFAELITQIFGGDYTYQIILNNQENIFNAMQELLDAKLTVVFAQDLGKVEEFNYQFRYNQTINQIIEQLQLKLLAKTGNVLFSEHTGNITELSVKNKSRLSIT